MQAMILYTAGTDGAKCRPTPADCMVLKRIYCGHKAYVLLLFASWLARAKPRKYFARFQHASIMLYTSARSAEPSSKFRIVRAARLLFASNCIPGGLNFAELQPRSLQPVAHAVLVASSASISRLEITQLHTTCSYYTARPKACLVKCAPAITISNRRGLAHLTSRAQGNICISALPEP